MNNIQKLAFVKFTLWLLTLVLIIFIGTTNVFAEEVDVGYVTSKTTILFENNQAQAMTSLPHTTSANQYLYNILVIQLNNQSILKDYLYQLEIYTPNAKFKNISNIYITGGNNNSTVCQTIGLDTSNTSYPKIYFTCPTNLNYLTFGLNNDNPTTLTEPITTATNFQWNYTYLRYFTEEDDIDLGPVISNQTQNTNNIINNNNQNTQQIIDNQNQLLGTKCKNEWNPILKTATTHRGITFTPVLKNGFVEKYVINGTRTSGSNAYVTMMTNFTLNQGTHIKVYSNGNIYLQLYDGTNVINTKDYTATETKTWSQVSIFTTQSPIDNVDYKVMITPENDTTFCLYGSYISKLDNTTNAINGMTDALTDDSPISLDQISSTAGWLPAGPIDSIINLPLNFFNGLLTALNGTCQPLHVPIPYLDNKYMDIPCISTIFNQIDGLPNFWNWVGAICSVVILYRYLLSLYKYYDDLTTLKANFISDFGGAP